MEKIIRRFEKARIVTLERLFFHFEFLFLTFSRFIFEFYFRILIVFSRFVATQHLFIFAVS